MKFALLIIEFPPEDIPMQALNDMGNLLREIQQEVSLGGLTVRLNAGTYLCDLKHGLGELSAIDSAAKGRKCQTRVLFFEQVPQFVPPR